MRLAILSLALHGCSLLGCTEMFAPSMLTLELEADEWPAGTYELELNGYNQFAMCVVTLPSAEGDLVSCTDNATLELDPEGAGVERMLAIQFAPESFQVTILRDGEPVSEERFAPEYEVDEPNGAGCGERSRATVTMTL